ncbi:toxin glutamine deamidase domain-containing protein [Arthrobacter sp. CJ23]|uniref:toxin glutamine deamidase domain-containing protein n=1 Tax=Arthrobacter sp. CJ23 TaxID=2972479 RepID=UPI00215B918B|nr:toxin glutamine deamidase domain-containing protein [Arthrobacter sp. CJ23]UVJ38045.1 toxin glutamine deamidase domain-containing protein [Arthrobacter sp. CJ23]
MSSILVEACGSLHATGREARGVASHLHRTAVDLAGAFTRASAVIGTTSHPAPRQALAALQNASKAAELASVLLDRAAQRGDDFVARTLGNTLDARPLGESSPLAPETRAVQSIADVRGWLESINPGYSGDPFDPRSSNCGSCALAVFNRLDGSPAAAAEASSLSIEEVEKATGRKQTPMTSSEIREHLVRQVPGSHAIVGIDRLFGPGHWFNAYFDGNEVVALDGQTGTIHGWPPDYGSPKNPVVYWDVGV